MIPYDAGISLLEGYIRLSGLWNRKNRLWAEGRRGILDSIRAAIGPEERIFWLHAASVGEFEQGRPLLERIRAEHPEYRILLTFYSPSGYMLRRNWKGADYVFYFPSDRPSVVREFLDAAHPEIAVFVKYEFWLETLAELRRRRVRTFLISAIFRKNCVFFLPCGRVWRKALGTFETIFVQNEESRRLLDGIGVRSTVAGDTRFDRVMRITQNPEDIPLVRQFCSNAPVFVAGSTWEGDERILLPLANANPGIKFIIAPHEMDEGRIEAFISGVHGGAVRYTAPCDDIADRQVLILDTVGMLSTVYRYASWAYVGGGFRHWIHNTIEPAAYGIPVAFGPRYGKFREAVDMVRLGAAKSVKNYGELSEWFAPLRDRGAVWSGTCAAASTYVRSQLGATDAIITEIFGQ